MATNKSKHSVPVATNKRKHPKARAKLSRVRAAAGRAGAEARWAGVDRCQTTLVRVYVADAARLRAQPGTVAEAVHRLMEGAASSAAT